MEIKKLTELQNIGIQGFETQLLEKRLETYGLTLFHSALSILHTETQLYSSQYGILPEQSLRRLSYLDDNIPMLKARLEALSIPYAPLSLGEIQAALEPLEGDTRNEALQQVNLLLEASETQSIPALEQISIELRNALFSIQSAYNNLEHQKYLLPAIVIASVPALQGGLLPLLTDLNGVISVIDSTITFNKQRIAELEADILGYTSSTQNLAETIFDLKRKVEGFNYYLARPTLNSRIGIYEATKSGTMNIASKDLTEVMNLTNEKYQDNLLFISIHLNATEAKVTEASGMRIFYRDNNPDSGLNLHYYKGYNATKRRNLAMHLLTQTNAATPFSQNPTQTNRADFSVLRENNLVSALVEVGFMNNPTDLSQLLMPNVRDGVAYGVYRGIVEYYRELHDE